MDKYQIDVIVPTPKQNSSNRIGYVVKADSLQEAADMVFAREIFKGEQYLETLSLLGYESVIKRKEIKVAAYFIFDEKGNIKKDLLVNSFSAELLNGDSFKHPERLSDSELKQLLKKDEEINKQGLINPATIDNMIFLI